MGFYLQAKLRGAKTEKAPRSVLSIVRAGFFLARREEAECYQVLLFQGPLGRMGS